LAARLLPALPQAEVEEEAGEVRPDPALGAAVVVEVAAA
jgi:hypothetical protein